MKYFVHFVYYSFSYHAMPLQMWPWIMSLYFWPRKIIQENDFLQKLLKAWSCYIDRFVVLRYLHLVADLLEIWPWFISFGHGDCTDLICWAHDIEYMIIKHWSISFNIELFTTNMIRSLLWAIYRIKPHRFSYHRIASKMWLWNITLMLFWPR